ncbi:MAG: hypothetical protein ACODAG_06580 [Myxococcota bacterium]
MWIRPSPDNARRVVDALRAFGAAGRPQDLADVQRLQGSESFND